MKSKRPKKCPECKGTGTQQAPPAYPPRRTEDVPSYKCQECNGTGKAQHFEMFFWHYDQFPYVIASRGFMQDNGYCYCPSYNGSFRPFMSLPLEEGKKEAAWLAELKEAHDYALKVVREGFHAQLKARMPKALKK